jgi:WD40 repeat protein
MAPVCGILTLCLLAGAAARGAVPFLRIEPGGHTAAVRKILFAAQGTQLISVGKDKAVRLWDVATGRQMRTLRAFIGPDLTGEIYAAALSPDERLLAVGGYDLINRNTWQGELPTGGSGCDIRLFDLASGRLLRLLSAHAGSINALAFSRTGLLASASADKTVVLWDPKTGRHRTCAHGAYVSDVAFSPEGGQVASAGYDGIVRLWDAETGKALQRLDCGAAATCLAWSPDGATLAIGTRSQRILLWNPATGAQRPALAQQDDPTCLAFSPDSRLLLSGSGETEARNDRKVRLWDVGAGKLIHEFAQHTGTLFSVAFAPDGQTAASADLAGTIYLWDTGTGAVRRRLKGTGSSVFAVAWSPDGKRLAWGHTEGGPQAPAPLEQVFDLADILPQPAARAGRDWQAAQAEREGRTLTISPDRRAVGVQEGGRIVRSLTLPDPQDRILCATWTPAGQVAIGSNFAFALYDPARPGQPLRRYFGHDGPILAVAPSPDGRYLASASADQTVRVWSLSDRGRRIGTEAQGVEPLLSLFQGSDGEWVAWTPPGYYASSPAGDDIIGWQVNRGRDQEAEFHVATRFHKQFYRPDVLRHVLETGDVPKALALADQETGKQSDPVVTIVAEIPKLPRVEIVAITPSARQADGSFVTDKTEVQVRVRIANAPAKTVALQIGVSTRLVSEERARDLVVEEAGERADEVTLRVRLRSGALNVIRVVGRNDSGQSEPAEARVVCQAAEEPSRPPALYLLSVGISVFTDRSIDPLTYTVRDAEGIANFYRGQKNRLFSDVFVTLLTDRQATKQNLLNALADIQKQIKPNDLFIFFVASHGRPAQDRQRGGERYYLATYDTINREIAQTGLAGEALLQRLQQIDATVLMIMDTCHSGSINLEQTYTDLLHSARHSVYSFTACRPEERSYEDEAWQHGAFTYKLLEALRRPPPPGREGRWDLDEVAPYVRDEVERIVREKKQQSQRPRFYPSPLADERLPVAAVR